MLAKVEQDVEHRARNPHHNRKNQVVMGMEINCHVFVSHNDQTDVVQPDVIAVETDRPCLAQTDP